MKEDGIKSVNQTSRDKKDVCQTKEYNHKNMTKEMEVEGKEEPRRVVVVSRSVYNANLSIMSEPGSSASTIIQTSRWKIVEKGRPRCVAGPALHLDRLSILSHRNALSFDYRAIINWLFHAAQKPDCISLIDMENRLITGEKRQVAFCLSL
jgi:hypothetical protein